MSFDYPATVVRDVVHISRNLPPKAFEAHGVGILEKPFDIGCSSADTLVVNPVRAEARGLVIGPEDYLIELVNLLGTLFGGTLKYWSLLASKADECLGRIKRSLPGSEDTQISCKLGDELSACVQCTCTLEKLWHCFNLDNLVLKEPRALNVEL